MNNFNNNYTLWFHDVKSNNWTIDSYDKLYTIKNNYDIIINKLHFTNNHLLKGMFFMKNDIEPIWENEENCKGGYISYKISNKIAYDLWLLLINKTINKELVTEDECYNGFSYTPKNNFGIIKLWFNKVVNKNIVKLNDPRLDIKKSLFKKYI